VLDKDCCEITQFNREAPIPPASGTFLRIFIKQHSYNRRLSLPRFHVSIRDNAGGLRSEFVSPSVSVESFWSSKAHLIGSQYRAILDEMEKRVLENGELGVLALTGSSGTGKTRLLEETIGKLLKNGYRILKFVDVEGNNAADILREIIFFLYEIPGAEVLQQLENYIGNEQEEVSSTIESPKPVHKAYKLAQMFKEASEGKDLYQTIDKYGAILFEKLSAAPIALLVDNIQYLGNEILYFLSKYIAYSQCQNRRNLSVLICTFNTDYLKPESASLMMQIRNMYAHKQLHALYREVKGFDSIEQGVLFLREYLKLGTDESHHILELIVKKVSCKPFHLTQAAEYLLQQNGLSNYGDKARIRAPLELTEKVMLEMPEDIENILHGRWNFFISEYEDASSAELIISCVMLFRVFPEYLISKLKLRKEMLDALLGRGFLRMDISKSEPSVLFEHDLIENFFYTRDTDLPMIALNYLIAKNFEDELHGYPFVHLYCQLSKNLDSRQFQETLDQLKYVHIPLNLREMFFALWFSFIKRNMLLIDDHGVLCRIFHNLCMQTSDYFGVERSIEYYRKSYEEFRSYCHEFLLDPAGQYRGFINSYTDNLMQSGHPDLAIQVLKDALELYQSENNHNDEWLSNVSLFYNRLLDFGFN
jgi:hypothetical protein